MVKSYVQQNQHFQPLKLEIKKKLCSRSGRVKSVDIHPEYPWILAAMYSGNVTIYDYEKQVISTFSFTYIFQTTEKNFELSDCPVRCAKFIVKKQWFAACSDDLQVRIYNYNTMEKIKSFEAHKDFIRWITVHPTYPYILTSSDDGHIKVFDYDKDFRNIKDYDQHQHYVMMTAINPRDPQTFASACLDKTIKVWNLSTNVSTANYTLQGHKNGVNCVDYFKGDKPYIVSGADLGAIKIWDYQTKQCIKTLEGHENNVSYVHFHVDLPILLSTSEDGSTLIWHTNTYKLEQSLKYNMDRGWAISSSQDGNIIAIGYDDGTLALKIGGDEPLASMKKGKIVWAKNMEIQLVNLKSLKVSDIKDGELIQVYPKDLGTSDIYPQKLQHNPNGHIFAINSDKEYQLYRSQTFKNTGFGNGMDFVWASNGNYAVRDAFKIKVHKSNGGHIMSIKPDYKLDGLFGGELLCIKSKDFIVFYSWIKGQVVRRIDVNPKIVIWDESGTRLALVTDDGTFLLRYNKGEVDKNIDSLDPDEGFDKAFDVIHELQEIVTSGYWVHDCFFFTNDKGKLHYTIGGKLLLQGYTGKSFFIIGYIKNQQKLYLLNKGHQIISFEVVSQVCEFQTAIIQKDKQKAQSIIEEINEKHYNKVAKFLDLVDLKQLAFQITQDIDHKFELALGLKKIEEAYQIAIKSNNRTKLKQAGDLALLFGKIEYAIECLEKSDDLSGLFLIFTSLGMKDNLRKLAHKAVELTRTNIAFQSFFLIHDLQNCIKVLVESNRIEEAAFFAKTYCPSQLNQIVTQWKQSLQKEHPITSQKIANPLDYPDQFDDLIKSVKVEEFLAKNYNNLSVPADQHQEYLAFLSQDFLKLVKESDAKLEDTFKFKIKGQQQKEIEEIKMTQEKEAENENNDEEEDDEEDDDDEDEDDEEDDDDEEDEDDEDDDEDDDENDDDLDVEETQEKDENKNVQQGAEEDDSEEFYDLE